MSCNNDSIREITSAQQLISVIMAVKNSVTTIERAIQSVLAQHYRCIEYIVIDGASTDGTVEILNKYSCNIDHVLSEPDSGVYAAWNKGLKLAHGDWVCFLGADDYFSDSSSLEKFVSAMDVSLTSKTAVVYGQLNFVDSSESLVNILRIPWEKAKQGYLSFLTIPHVATLHKRTLFDEFGEFDESFMIAGDYEFLLRVFEYYDALFVPGVVQASMTLGGISNRAENYRCSWTEMKKAKKMHPLNQVNLGLWYVIALFKIAKFHLGLLLYENLPESMFIILLRFHRIIFSKTVT